MWQSMGMNLFVEPRGSLEERQLFQRSLLDVWDLNIILVKKWMRCSTYTSRLALFLQVKNILYHCVKEAASSLKKSGSEKDDEEHNSWCPLSLAFHRWLWLHQHLALSTPSSFCHGGLCHVTTINGWLKAGHVIQRTSQCDPHSCHTSSGQWEALPPLSSPQTFSAKRSQIEEQLGWEGWKPHRLQTQSECWLGASLEPAWWSESALQTSKLVKCRFHGGSDCSSTGAAALTALDDKGQEL